MGQGLGRGPTQEVVERDVATEKRRFMARDSFSYPMFQAGPRICLGKEMSFLQMKRVVAEVLKRFKVVPAGEEGEWEGAGVACLPNRKNE
ncbi:putative cytochrome P450 [Rosa chinensis]|uniref:Putative cytochrome P450 n=1 Tax=Rosa chinensis TaxID=74649 RepID=A0A2P6PQ48_ROSCH|nr:putative cytochrome P450 [Rosa chinensis]